MLDKNEVYSTLDKIKNKFPNTHNTLYCEYEFEEDLVLEVNQAYHWCVNVALAYPLRKSLNTSSTSYAIKHIIEKWLKLGNSINSNTSPYISNLAAIIAFKLCDINCHIIDNQNRAYTNISQKAFA